MSLLARPGSDDDWGEVVDLHEPTLRRVIMRRTADRSLVEDALQETYARAWRARISGSQRGMPDARWMRMLATRASIDVYRRQPRMDELDPAALVGEWLTADRAAPPGSDEHIEALVSRQAVRWAFRRLTGRQRRLLVLRGVRNLSYREIAEREGISESAVTSALNRARERLRVHLAEHDEGDTGTPVVALLGLGLAERWRTRMARLYSTLGAHAVDLVCTTAALGVAVAVSSPVPAWGAVAVAAANRPGGSNPAVLDQSAERRESSSNRTTSPATTRSPPAEPGVGAGASTTPAGGPLRTATNLDIGADETTFRLDVSIDIPGIDDRGRLMVEVYCTRSSVLRPTCPTLDSLEPRSSSGTRGAPPTPPR